MSAPHALRRVTLRIDSRLDQVGLLGRAVSGMCVSAGLPRRQCALVELALVEAVNNVIRHAYRGEAGHPVEVTFALADDHFVLEVVDEGEPMPDRPARPLAYDPADRAALPEGGMGLHIIRRVMDDVAWRREGERNAFTMRRRLAA